MHTKTPISIVKTVFRLGIGNVFRVVIYRLALKSYYYQWRLPAKPPLSGPLFEELPNDLPELPTFYLQYFSVHKIACTTAPNWFANPWKSDSVRADAISHWTKIPDFAGSIGDVKTVWEPSRFDWAPKFAVQAQLAGGISQDSIRLELWLRDWLESNPPNMGVNWKCGQEASLRALNLLLTAKILGENYESPKKGLLAFFEVHLLRILPTTYYAKAQDNNHGTSEAAALFSLGAYLHRYGSLRQQRLGSKANKVGRRFLENRVRKIIMIDGSFSQSSVVYHRLMLDTIVLCELTRKEHGLAHFSDDFYVRMRAASHWLNAMVDRVSGDAPNIGSNDGAYFGNIENLPYRDFRPSLKRALAIFCETNLCSHDTDELLDIYGIDYNSLKDAQAVSNCYFPHGGYARLNIPKCDGYIIFRYPKYSFRPGHCDANHIDIWANGQNLTLGAGSYSYNTDIPEYRDYFGGTKSNCTIMLDDRDQMPRLRRMLLGEWLQPDIMCFDDGKGSIVSRYTDYAGAWHQRKVTVEDKSITIVDEFGGFKNNAVLRWRIPRGSRLLESGKVENENFSISFSTTTEHIKNLEYEKNSLHYLEVEDIPVVRILFGQPAVIQTHIAIE